MHIVIESILHLTYVALDAIDSIAICILQHAICILKLAICILQKKLGNIDISSKSF